MNTSVWAVQGWEQNKYTSKVYRMKNIIEFLGFVRRGMLPRTPADKVIFCRAVLGLTQKELGQLLCVCDANISRWDNGKSRPKQEYLNKLEFLLTKQRC